MSATDHAELRAHIAERLARLSQPDALIQIATDLSVMLELGAPHATGTLAEAVSERGAVTANAVGMEVGVGNKKRLGEPDDKAPLGTIAAFLRSDEGKKYRTKGVSQMPGWEKRKAWSFLREEGKRALQEQRQLGLYGGPAYGAGKPAKYYYSQDASKPEWAVSAYGAGLENSPNQGFTTNILNYWRTTIGKTIAGFLSR